MSITIERPVGDLNERTVIESVYRQASKSVLARLVGILAMDMHGEAPKLGELQLMEFPGGNRAVFGLPVHLPDGICNVNMNNLVDKVMLVDHLGSIKELHPEIFDEEKLALRMASASRKVADQLLELAKAGTDGKVP